MNPQPKHPPQNLQEFKTCDASLNSVRRQVVYYFLQGKSDFEITTLELCTEGNVRQHIAGACKDNFYLHETPARERRDELKKIYKRYQPASLSRGEIDRLRGNKITKPKGGPLPLGSDFYISRNDIEQDVQYDIQEPGALLRIRAPHRYGKTSFVQRILEQATQNLGYRAAEINFDLVDDCKLQSLDRFLQWFCHIISEKLSQPANLNSWDADKIGSKTSCSNYLEQQILAALETPLVLVLDNIHCLFEYPIIIKELSALLRSWFEKANHSPLFENLRQIIVYSTDIYIRYDLNQSPFNVGDQIQLAPFNAEQVRKLAWRYGFYGLDSLTEAGPLMKFLGGHPYLTQLGLYRMSDAQLSLEDFFREASQQDSIYEDHFLDCRNALDRHEGTLEAFRQVLEAKEALRMDAIAAKKLEGLGLIRRKGNYAQVSCPLYEQYFRRELCL